MYGFDLASLCFCGSFEASLLDKGARAGAAGAARVVAGVAAGVAAGADTRGPAEASELSSSRLY